MKFKDFFAKKAGLVEIKVEISARHVHLSEGDLAKLFGAGYKLKPAKPLSQTGQFAAEETLSLKAQGKTLAGVRVVGPTRAQTQIELSKTDAHQLGLNLSLSLSGNLGKSSGIILVGPKAELAVESGTIIAQRHIHCSTSQAKQYGLKNGQIVKVKIGGERGLVFYEVAVRVDHSFDWRLQLDTDEANAAGVDNNSTGQVIV